MSGFGPAEHGRRVLALDVGGLNRPAVLIALTPEHHTQVPSASAPGYLSFFAPARHDPARRDGGAARRHTSSRRCIGEIPSPSSGSGSVVGRLRRLCLLATSGGCVTAISSGGSRTRRHAVLDRLRRRRRGCVVAVVEPRCRRDGTRRCALSTAQSFQLPTAAQSLPEHEPAWLPPCPRLAAAPA